MYENIYFDSFLINVIFSIIFTILVTGLSSISLNINNKTINLFSRYQPIIIFFSFFLFLVTLFNYLIIFELTYLFDVFLIAITIFITLYVFISKNYLANFFYFNAKKLIIAIFTIFFLVALLPITDADSIAIHQLLANHIYLNGFNNINLFKDVEFLSLANSEILLILSPILKIENIGALLNFLSLLLFFKVIQDQKKNFIFFIFSCPLILFLVSTQKLQLFFGILYLILFIVVNEDLIKKKLEIFLFLSLLAFYASAKINYILFAFPLYVYFLMIKKDNLKFIFISSLLIFTFIFCPIFLIKYIYFGNPIAPFFDGIFSTNRFLFDSYALSLRSSEGWLQSDNFLIYIKPFFPTSINQLSSSLGLLFLIFLFNFNLQKKTKFFPLIILTLVLFTGQILPRYYLESFLILSYYYSFNKSYPLTKIIMNLQLIMTIFFSTIFLFISYFSLNVIHDKKRYMEKFSYTYFNNQEYNMISVKENILDLNEPRTSLFFKKNIFSTRHLNNQKLFGNNSSKEMIEYIKSNNIKYIVKDDSIHLPKCLKSKKVGKILKKKSTRNFLVDNKKFKSYLYKIININC